MERRISRVLTAGAISALLLTTYAGAGLRSVTGTSAASLAANAGTLVVGRHLSDGKTLDPGRSYEFSASAVQQNVYDQLITYTGSHTNTPRPALATSWESRNNARSSYFHLRHGLRFSIG